MRILSMFNNKGGVTKTTSAMLIGELLSTTGYPSLIIDNDSQGTLSIDNYDISPESVGMAELLENPERLMEAIHKTRVNNLFVIPPGKDLETIAQAWDARGQLKEKVQTILNEIKEKLATAFDICIIDNPPRFHGISMYSSAVADQIIMPAESEMNAFKATIRTYIEMKKSYPYWDMQDVSILVTKHKKVRSIAGGHLIAYRNWVLAERMSYQERNRGKTLKLKVLKATIPDSADVENMKHEKQNIFLKKSTSEISRAYILITEELIPELEGELSRNLKEIIESRKKENFLTNILPNAFQKAVAQERVRE